MFSKSKNEKGQGLVEYAIILALVAIVVIGVMRILGPKVGCTFSGINNSLPGGSGSPSSNCGGASSNPYANTFGLHAYGWEGAVNNYCNQAGSGSSYNLYALGSGWNVAGGPNTTVSGWTGGGTPTFVSAGSCQ